MKYLITALLLLTLSGCAAYDGFLKPAYKAGKVVVKEIPVSEETAEKLRKIDKIATTYDKARGVFIIEYGTGK